MTDWVLMLWERESHPRQVRLLEEEEEVDDGEVPNIPWGDNPAAEEKVQALVWVSGGQALQAWPALCGLCGSCAKQIHPHTPLDKG